MIFFNNVVFSDEFSKTLTNIGPWTIKAYSDEMISHTIGQPCAAVQYANGAELMLLADVEQPENKKTIQLFVSFGGPYNEARVWIDDAMKFDHYLANYEVNRHGHSGVFSVSDVIGRKLFVRFEVRRFDVGRYEFQIGDIRAVSAYLHQKKCVFGVEESMPISKKQIDSILVGDTYGSVVSRLGVADSSYLFTEDNTEGYEYQLGNKKIVIIVFDTQKRVVDKVIKSK